MTYRFVAARWFSPGKRVECRALALHMAEGGGTVSYLRDPRHGDGTPIDVSATFVIEYDGDIVQMVRDGDADHCQHVSPGTWSYPGDLRPRNGRLVLGNALMDNLDPTRVNRYVQAIEMEGHRALGPNDKQIKSLIELVAERRAKYGDELRGLLGHGDIQNKPCPGAGIPWELLGGHGLFVPATPPPPEVPVRDFTHDPATAQTGTITVAGTGHYYLRLEDASLHGPIDPKDPRWINRPAYGPVTLTPDIDGKDTTGDRAKAFILGTELAAILAKDVTFSPATRPANPLELADARAAGRESFRKDVEAIP